MAKDPAFLFYSSDFITGVAFMSDEQVGKYIRLLCMQHLHGRLSEKHMMHICKTYDADIFAKFKKDANGLYFNQRADDEINKRKNFTESRKANRISKKDIISSTYEKHMIDHMENENINEIEIINETEGKNEKKIDFEEVLNHWNRFAEEVALPQIKAMNKSRRDKIINRSKESEFDFNNILNEIRNSDFLKGLTSTFKVSFDWIFKSENNYIKIIEGNYRNGKPKQSYGNKSKGFDIDKERRIAERLASIN